MARSPAPTHGNALGREHERREVAIAHVAPSQHGGVGEQDGRPDRASHPGTRPRAGAGLRGAPRAAQRQAAHGRAVHLPRSFRADGRAAGRRRHGGAAASAYRARHRHLSVRRRHLPSRQPGLCAGDPPGRRQLDDRRQRHRPQRAHRARDEAHGLSHARRPDLGGAAQEPRGDGAVVRACREGQAAGVDGRRRGVPADRRHLRRPHGADHALLADLLRRGGDAGRGQDRGVARACRARGLCRRGQRDHRRPPADRRRPCGVPRRPAGRGDRRP